MLVFHTAYAQCHGMGVGQGSFAVLFLVLSNYLLNRYILSDEMPNIGTLRETIFFAWLRVEHFVSSSSVSDFEVDGLTFEIGGKNKGRKQLETLPLDKAYVVKDDTEYVFQNSIPLWMFGFVY